MSIPTGVGIALAVIELSREYGDLIKEVKPKPHVRRKMIVDLPVYDMRIGMTYLDGKRKGIIQEVIPLGRRNRTHVEVLVKYPDKSVKHYRHELIGMFETEA